MVKNINMHASINTKKGTGKNNNYIIIYVCIVAMHSKNTQASTNSGSSLNWKTFIFVMLLFILTKTTFIDHLRKRANKIVDYTCK